MYDTLGEYLKPPLQGFRLADDELAPVEPEASGALISQELGLRLQRDGTYLRLNNLASGQPLLRPAELDRARRAAEERASAAEEEVQRLRAELARLRGEK
jgi:hypothetical protein